MFVQEIGILWIQRSVPSFLPPLSAINMCFQHTRPGWLRWARHGPGHRWFCLSSIWCVIATEVCWRGQCLNEWMSTLRQMRPVPCPHQLSEDCSLEQISHVPVPHFLHLKNNRNKLDLYRVNLRTHSSSHFQISRNTCLPITKERLSRCISWAVGRMMVFIFVLLIFSGKVIITTTYGPIPLPSLCFDCLYSCLTPHQLEGKERQGWGIWDYKAFMLTWHMGFCTMCFLR